MLTHPLREFARRLFGKEHLSVGQLDDLADRIGTAGLPSPRDLPGSADSVASTAVGVAEGIRNRFLGVFRGKSAQIPARTEYKAGVESSKSLHAKFQKLEKKAESYLAIAGIKQPPNVAELEETIGLVVAYAKVNKSRIGENGFVDFPSLDDFARIAQPLVGLNQGEDKIEQVRVVDFIPRGRKNRDIAMHAFDRRGLHVMWIEFAKLKPGVVYVDSLRAAHGRNCEDFALDMGSGSVPGRGNALLTATGLEALIVEGVKNGLHALATSPGSPMVARLYEKMGFTSPASSAPFSKQRLLWALEQLPVVSEAIDGAKIVKKEMNVMEQVERGEEPNYLMYLDLTNPEAVRQALVAFRLSRANLDDVPKGVGEKLAALGEAPPKPLLKTWARSLGQDRPNVRVLK